jgi:hypothetical protein
LISRFGSGHVVAGVPVAELDVERVVKKFLVAAVLQVSKERFEIGLGFGSSGRLRTKV